MQRARHNGGGGGWRGAAWLLGSGGCSADAVLRAAASACLLADRCEARPVGRALLCFAQPSLQRPCRVREDKQQRWDSQGACSCPPKCTRQHPTWTGWPNGALGWLMTV